MIPSPDHVEPITQREVLTRIASLQELMDEKLDHIETKVDAIKDAAELAYPNREEYSALERRVGKTENIQAEVAGKASKSSTTITLVIALAALVLSAIGLVAKFMGKG